jgi:hypothetical protein
MTQEMGRPQRPASAPLEPRSLPAELQYIAADVMALSPKAAKLLRAAARQIEDDLWVSGSKLKRASRKESPKTRDHLRLVQ